MSLSIVERDVALHDALNTPFEIYGLVDPRDGRINYVGRAKRSRAARVKYHVAMCHCETNENARWIRELLRLGLAPFDVLLARVIGAERAIGAEQYWFDEGTRLGWPLKNAQRPSGSGLGLGLKERRCEWTLARLGLSPRPWAVPVEP